MTEIQIGHLENNKPLALPHRPLAYDEADLSSIESPELGRLHREVRSGNILIATRTDHRKTELATLQFGGPQSTPILAVDRPIEVPMAHKAGLNLQALDWLTLVDRLAVHDFLNFPQPGRPVVPLVDLTDLGHLRESGVRLTLVEDPTPAETAWRKETLEALDEACRLATTENWDGYGAAPFDTRSYEYARRLLAAIAKSVTLPDRPEIRVDPDGETSLNWQRASRLVFSISVASDGSLSYAGLFGPNEVYGVEQLAGTVPKAIAGNLERLLSTPPPTEGD